MSDPAVSVLIPAYNHAAFLREAIDSVLAQRFADFELIVIDDASSDASWEIIESYADARLHASRHAENQGAHATLNEALSLARGRYLSILNSDDRYHPDRLQRLFDACEAHGHGLIGSRVRLIDAASEPVSAENDWLRHYRKLLAIHAQQNELLAALCAGNVLITTSNFFFRRELYDAIGGFADWRYVHDYDFALKAARHPDGAALLDDTLLDYRLHDTNTIDEAPVDAINETVELLDRHTPAIVAQARSPRALPLLTGQFREQMGWLEGVYRHRLYLKDQTLAEDQRRVTALQDALAEARDDALAARNSHSYRLGFALLRPVRWLSGLRQRLDAARHGTRIASLAALRPLIEQQRDALEAVSFDIFDTLLARHVEPPEAVQLAVARTLTETLNADGAAPGLSAERLQRLREQAESRLRATARRGGGDGECHFDMLARHWAEAIASQLGRDTAPIERLIHATEMATEQRALYVKPGAKTLLEWLRDQPLTVIATSDMYLGKRHLIELLEAKGLFELLDEVHVSSETGLCKHSGKLFHHLLREHGWRAEQLLHVGDNAHSDHLAPRRAGVRGVWLRESAELRRRARQRAAWTMRERGAIWPGNWFFDCLDDYPPPADAAREQRFFFDYGRWRLGPVFCTFMAGLVERLQRENPARIFFVARDGYLFHQLYRQRPDHDRLPPSAYLYASRRAIAAAAIADGMTPEQAGVALLNPKQQGLLSILKTFALAPDDYRDTARRHGFDDLAAPLASSDDPRLQTFLADPDVGARMRAAGQRARALLEGYLEQIGFFGGDSVALVDIGWNGTIQRFLRDAFGAREDFPRLLGYYFAFVGEIHDKNGRDHIEGLLHDADRDPKTWKVAGEFEELFEQGARALEATTLGYTEKNGRIEPLLKSDSDIDRKQELASNPMIAALHRGVLSLQPDYLDTQALTGLGFDDLKPYARALIERLVIYPTRDEVEHITRLAHSEDFGHDHTLELLDAPLRWRDLPRPRAVIARLTAAPWQSALFVALPTRLWAFAFRWLKLRRQARAEETP